MEFKKGILTKTPTHLVWWKIFLHLRHTKHDKPPKDPRRTVLRRALSALDALIQHRVGMCVVMSENLSLSHQNENSLYLMLSSNSLSHSFNPSFSLAFSLCVYLVLLGAADYGFGGQEAFCFVSETLGSDVVVVGIFCGVLMVGGSRNHPIHTHRDTPCISDTTTTTTIIIITLNQNTHLTQGKSNTRVDVCVKILKTIWPLLDLLVYINWFIDTIPTAELNCVAFCEW